MRSEPKRKAGEVCAGEGAAYSADPAPVLDERKLSDLVALMGLDWVTRRLILFAEEISARLKALDRLTSAELAATVHQMAGMAGYCGFMELGDLCASIQRDARQGGGGERIPALRAAAERTLAVISLRAGAPQSG